MRVAANRTALQGRSVEHIRVAGVHDEVRYAGMLVDGEHGLPGLAAVGSLVNTPVSSATPEGPDSGYVHYIGVAVIDNDLTDMLGIFESDILPTAAAILAFVYAVTVGNGALIVIFARSVSDYIKIIRIYGNTSYGV